MVLADPPSLTELVQSSSSQRNSGRTRQYNLLDKNVFNLHERLLEGSLTSLNPVTVNRVRINMELDTTHDM